MILQAEAVHEKHERHEKKPGILVFAGIKTAAKDFPFVPFVYFVDKVFFAIVSNSCDITFKTKNNDISDKH